MTTGFKETKIGWIPGDWEMKPIKRVASLNMGQSPSSSDCNDKGDGIPFYQGNADFGSKNPVTRNWTTNPTKIAKAGDILMSVRAPVGEFNFADKQCCIGRGLCAFTAKPETDSLCLYFLLKALLPRLLRVQQGSTFQAVNRSDIDTFFLPLPPLPEQNKIAQILSTVDETIEKTDYIIEETQQLKKGLMQKLFTEGIGHTRFKETKIGRIPDDWEVVNLFDVFQVIDGDRGVNYPKSHEIFDDGYCVFLNAKNVTKFGFKFDEVQFITEQKDKIMGKGKLTRGDFVLTTRGTLGNFAYFDNHVAFENLRINSGMVVLRPLNDIVSNYYDKYFKSNFMQNQVRTLSFGTAQSQLTVGGIQKFKLLVPPYEEQCKIAETLSEVDAKIETEQTFKSELEQLKKGLMQVLLTGKVRVKV